MRLPRLAARMDDLSRRAFLLGSARGLVGLSAVPWAPLLFRRGDDPIELRPATARNVIFLYMSGGMSHLDTFDPKPGSAVQGPTRVIDTNVDGVQVSSHFAHMARMMDRVAVVNSVSSNQGAHAQGRYFMHASYPLRGTIRHPTLGAWLSRMAGRAHPTLPGHVSIGGDIYGPSAGFFEPRHGPLPLGDPEVGLEDSQLPEGVSAETFHRRMQRVQEMNHGFAAKHAHHLSDAYAQMYDEAVRLMQSRDLAAFDLTDEPDSLRDAYGRDRFGQGCLLARRMVEQGVRFVEVVSGGWDSHNENFETMEEKCPELDRALAALLGDLEARGMLEETLVVLATEFGRTPDINSRVGRDHHPQAFTCLLAGGGVRGGVKYGMTDEEGREIVEDKVTVPDFNATLAYALGLPLDHVLTSPEGRPFTVADKGEPVTALFA